MIGQIYKIDQLKQSRNRGEVFYRVYFNMKGAMEGHKFWAKTDVVPSFRNYEKWKPLLKVGNIITGLNMRRPDEINADSNPKLVGWKEVRPEVGPVAQLPTNEESPQKSLL
jgi:hypothetical protein